MALTLGIDTSTVVCVGLADASQVLASAAVDDPQAHVEQLLPLVLRTLADAGFSLGHVSQIAVGVGPGPFTGLRVGVAAAATLGEALGVPVLGVCSLDALARQALGELAAPATASAGENGTELAQQLSLASVAEEGFIVASDARRKELYWAVYSAGGERLRGPYATVPGELPRLPVCGPAARLYPLPGAVSAAAARLDAGVLAAVADSLPGVGLEPLYLRRPDAEVTQKRKSVLPKPRISAAGLRRRP